MKLKEIFRFPETLLPLSILLGRFIVGDKPFDILLHDTYFVFGGSWWFNIFYAPFFCTMTVTWVIHSILRRRGGFTERWRWIQVLVTVIPWLTILILLASPAGGRIPTDRTYLDYSNFRWDRPPDGTIYVAPLIVFFLNQLIFWIVATIRIISARRRVSGRIS